MQKIVFKKNHLNFLQKKNLLQRKEKNLFQDSHALRIPCAIESALDHCCVSWRSWASPVHVHSVVIDLARGHLLHQAISHRFSAFFFFKKKKKAPCENCYANVFLCPFVLFFKFFEHFSDFFASIVLQNQKFHGRFFLLFSPPCFYSHVSCPFCLSLCFCQGDLMAEDKTRHQVKWVEATKENALANEFWLGLAALLCFLRLSDLCVTQTARGTPASECLSSSPNVSSLSIFALFMFTLLPQHLAKSFWKDWATWGGEAEPRGSDGRCRRSKEDRARKTNICGKATQRLARRNKQTGR